ncbi:hypothetical protein [uncultured Legionella sp.]|uniref:Rab family GTPase n=1 Tax=uncultured Legionella sp. TaxID=210934 RepID=UPI002620128F|nr:hypothetical protein [uncultured Legionella sp.]
MYLKTFILGSARVGKTELKKHLTVPNYVNTAEKAYFGSVAPDFNTVEIPGISGGNKVKMNVWDTSGNPHFKNASTKMFQEKSHFGLFCIDLSKPLTSQTISELKNDLAEFKQTNPEAHLILVGTKNDTALPDALHNAQKQFSDYQFIGVVATSAREANGSQELFGLLASHTPPIVEKMRQEQLKLADKLLKAEEERKNILYARDRCRVNSNLYIALDKLHHEANATLSPSQIKRLGKEANTLLDQFGNNAIQDKIPSIQAFITNCTEEIQGKNPALYNTLWTIAYALTVTVIASLIGFGIGFLFGAWSGPGAFFTGIAAGSTNALAAASSASACGAGTLAYSAHHFFKASPVLASIKEIAEIERQADLVQFYDSHACSEKPHFAHL